MALTKCGGRIQNGLCVLCGFRQLMTSTDGICGNMVEASGILSGLPENVKPFVWRQYSVVMPARPWIEFVTPKGLPCFVDPSMVTAVCGAGAEHDYQISRICSNGTATMVRGEPRDVLARISPLGTVETDSETGN